jgi:hypothetical protein
MTESLQPSRRDVVARTVEEACASGTAVVIEPTG